MKKKIISIALVTILVFCLTGCGNKSEITISFDGLDNYEVVETPSDVVSFSHTDDDINITVKENGDYKFVLADDDGNEYSFTLVYKDKKAEVKSDNEDIGVNVGIK